MAREVTATEFKATCLALLDDVAAGDEVIVTKRGRRVARLVPPERDGGSLPLRGSATYDDPDLLVEPTGERWDAGA